MMSYPYVKKDGCYVNRYLIHDKTKRTKEFFIKPGYHWLINSLGIESNAIRGFIKYPVSFEIIAIEDGNKIKCYASHGFVFFSRSQIMEYYHPMDHR